MDEESKKLLKETFDLTEENNRLLKKVRSVQKWNNFFRIFYWVIIIGASIGLFYFLQPYVDQVTQYSKEINNSFNKIKDLVPKK